MNSDIGLDWYTVSKMNPEKLDIKSFHQIISNCHPEHGIDRVSLQYRKKLLILFQNASSIIKQVSPDMFATNIELQVKRGIVADNLHFMEGQVEQSFKEVSNMKLILAEKQRLLGKLKDKLKKKNKRNARKVYCCTICNRQDFQSVEAFKAHYQAQHQENIINFSNTSNQMNDFKQLLMTMKDKQMEMMSMFLKASKEFQTQKLERDFDNEYKKFMHVSGAQTEESKQQQADPGQLKSQSQFLFFQKSDQFRRQFERQQDFRNKFSQERAQRQKATQNATYQTNSYYNVFTNINQNTSQHLQAPKRQTRGSEEKHINSYESYQPAEFLHRFLQNHKTLPSDSRCSLVQHIPEPLTQMKDIRTHEQKSVYMAPSISDRMKGENNKRSSHNETMYSTKRKFYEEKGYAFNSGPLLDDKGGDSDYQDYFGQNRSLNASIQDEEIKATQNNSHFVQLKESFHLSKILSPKNPGSSSFLDKSQKEKSSEIIDFSVSDSFSKRDFQISKDDQTINLSDLRLSKLQKKRQQERFTKKQKVLIDEKPPQPLRQTNEPKTSFIGQYQRQTQRQPVASYSSSSILKEFERPRVVPETVQIYQDKGNKRQLDQFMSK